MGTAVLLTELAICIPVEVLSLASCLSTGAAVLFTVLLRVAFLSKHMAKYMTVSIGMVIVGIGLIGMTDFLPPFTPTGYDRYGIAAGTSL